MRHPHFLKRTAGRFCSVLIFSFVLSVSASAYTVVMRGGRRVEVPSQFVVTATTLTYEVSPGVQVTLALATIDIPATEKANNELTGSLMRRLRSGSDLTVENSSQSRRTITNKDLEASMDRRRESELAYENRRKQLGLPSVEETRRRGAAEAEAIRLELEQKRAVEQSSESYWRERATALRTEMASLDAEIAYVRSRLEERYWWDGTSSGWSSLFFGVGVPFGFGRGSFGHPGGFPRPRHRPDIFVAPRSSAQLSGRLGFGNRSTRAQVFINPGSIRPTRPLGVGVGGPFGAQVGFLGVPVFGTSGLAYDNSYERSELITQFNQLGTARAGLNARWRELEDEARRAGAPPGWLRP